MSNTRGMIAGAVLLVAGLVVPLAHGGQAAPAAKRVLTVHHCISAKYKPRNIAGLCPGPSNHMAINGIKWLKYGRSEAVGSGKMLGNVLAGDNSRYPVSLRVFRPRNCKRLKARYFTRMSWRYTGRRPANTPATGKSAFPCSQMAKR